MEKKLITSRFALTLGLVLITIKLHSQSDKIKVAANNFKDHVLTYLIADKPRDNKDGLFEKSEIERTSFLEYLNKKRLKSSDRQSFEVKGDIERQGILSKPYIQSDNKVIYEVKFKLIIIYKNKYDNERIDEENIVLYIEVYDDDEKTPKVIKISDRELEKVSLRISYLNVNVGYSWLSPKGQFSEYLHSDASLKQFVLNPEIVLTINHKSWVKNIGFQIGYDFGIGLANEKRLFSAEKDYFVDSLGCKEFKSHSIYTGININLPLRLSNKKTSYFQKNIRVIGSISYAYNYSYLKTESSTHFDITCPKLIYSHSSVLLGGGVMFKLPWWSGLFTDSHAFISYNWKILQNNTIDSELGVNTIKFGYKLFLK